MIFLGVLVVDFAMLSLVEDVKMASIITLKKRLFYVHLQNDALSYGNCGMILFMLYI